jgi:hypothetical protein
MRLRSIIHWSFSLHFVISLTRSLMVVFSPLPIAHAITFKVPSSTDPNGFYSLGLSASRSLSLRGFSVTSRGTRKCGSPIDMDGTARCPICSSLSAPRYHLLSPASVHLLSFRWSFQTQGHRSQSTLVWSASSRTSSYNYMYCR